MNYELFVLMLTIFFILVLFVLRLMMPQIVRREIFFGVHIPEALINTPELYMLKRAYVRNYLFICGIYTFSFCVALLLVPNNTILVTGLIIFFLLSTWLYYLTHKKVKDFKKVNEANRSGKQVVIVDTSFRNDLQRKILPAWSWFLIPLAIIFFNIIMGYYAFDNLPLFIPSHWNAQGVIDGRIFKSSGIIFALPTVQFFITIFMYMLYKAIGWSKQQLNVTKPIDSKERNRLFRYRWGANIIFLNVFILFVITILNLFVLQIIQINMSLLLLMQPLLIMFIFLDVLIMAIWIGQSGSRINLSSTSLPNGNLSSLDDDKYWIGGLVYFNPQDPVLFVEKRFGIGWGLNYGTIKSYVLMTFVIGSVFLLNYILDLLLI